MSGAGPRLAAVRVLRAEGAGRAAAGAYSHWREEATRAVLNLYEVRPPLKRNFWIKAVRCELPDAALSQFDYVGMRYERPRARARADDFDGVMVQLNHRGAVRGCFGDRDVAVDPGMALFCDSSLPSVHDNTDTRGRMFFLPRSAFGGADLRRLHGRVVSGAAFARLDAYFRWLVEALPRAPLAAAPRVREAMAAVALATFAPETEPVLEASDALDGLTLRRLRDLAAVRAPEALDVETLAGALHVSRASLYRAAAPYGGVMALVWDARLEAAHARLSDPSAHRLIGEIAAEHGFATAPHFTRRFRERFGYTPATCASSSPETGSPKKGRR